MLTDLKHFLKRQGLTVRALIENQKVNSYDQLVNYCAARDLQPIAEAEFNSILGVPTKSAPKVQQQTIEPVKNETPKTKKRTTRRKTTRRSKTPSKTS